jgi:CRISPR-associated protein Csb1
LDYCTLTRAVTEDAALRRRQRLQPVGGQGDKMFPPTYTASEEMKRLLGQRNAPPRHVFERRRIDGAEVWCVLVDSVQSQANRLEEALLSAARAGAIDLPYVTVDFTGEELAGIDEVTSLDAPHRVYDAILRDSLYEGTPFMESTVGQRLAKANAEDASALLEVSPTALLFGAWHSTGQGGGLGAKFARCLISEIVGVDVPVEDVVVNQRTGETEVRTAARRTGSRIDPLGVLRKVKVFKGQDGWDTTKAGAGNNAKEVRPSEINHGNIAPSVQPLGVTCDYLEHSFVLSFAALRRLRFGGSEKDTAGRSLLAALGLVALTEQDAHGYALRSRCDLVCEGHAPFQLVRSDGKTEPIAIDRKQANELYETAFRAARKADFALSPKPHALKPQDKLVAIVRESQRLALEGKGGEEGEAKGNDSSS